jgi:RHS repeat-associated protein
MITFKPSAWLGMLSVLLTVVCWSSPAAADLIFKANKDEEIVADCDRYAATPEAAIDQSMVCVNSKSQLLNYFRDAQVPPTQPDGTKQYCLKTYLQSNNNFYASCAYHSTGRFVVECVPPQSANYNTGTCEAAPPAGCQEGEQLPGCADAGAPREKKQQGDPCDAREKNPINAATGNKYQREVDYTSPTGLTFARSYNSRSNEAGVLGAAWRHEWQAALKRYDSSAGSYVVATRDDGRAYYFTLTNGLWVNESDIKARLTQIANGYELTDGSVRKETYDAQGRLVQVDAGGPRKFTLAYAGNVLSTISDQFGHTLTLGYDGQGRLATVTAATSTVATFGYTNGNLTSVTYPGSNYPRVYHYEDANLSHALTGITDENNARYATWGYDAQTNRATSSEHAGGADGGQFQYNANGTTTITDSTGLVRIRGFAFSQGAYKAESTTAPGTSCGENSAATTYDANGFVAERTDFNGNVTQYSPNSRGLEESRTEAFGTSLARTITTQWHATFRLPMQIDEPGRRTTYTYDATGNRLTETVLDMATSESRTTTWTYNSLGQTATVDGPRTDVSDVTTYAYYVCTTGAQCGQVYTITNALGQVTTITSYDGHGNPLTIVDPNGVTTTLTYDSRQRLKTRSVAGATTTFDYDNVGQLDKATLPGGAFLDYTYDAAHRLTDIQDNDGNKIHYTLDTEGNRTAEEVFDPSLVLKRKGSQVFNALGRLEQVKNAAGTVVTEYGYDPQGNRTSRRDYESPSVSFLTTYTPDALNRIKTVTSPDGPTQYNYNALNQLGSVEDPKHLTTIYTLNALGDLKQLDSPDTGVTQYPIYDAAGNRKRQVDARGVQVDYTYDALNRLTFVDYYGTSAEDVTYSYDSTLVTYGKGRLTGIVDQSGVTTLSYDARGNVTQESRVINGTTYVTGYGYDTADRLTSITYPGGRVVTYLRNTLGQVYKVTTTNGGSTTDVLTTVSYLPFGGIKNYGLGSSVIVTRSHDLDYRLTEIKDQGTALIQDVMLYPNLRGDIDATADLLTPARSQTFDYDAMSRLTSATGLYGSQGFTYDAVGNRLTQSTDVYTYPTTSHRLTSISNGTSFSYNAAGNITAKGSLGLTYNSANRASSVGSVSNVYNAAGQRVIKTAGGQSTVFHYDRQGHLISESITGGPFLRRDYFWLDDLPVALEPTPTEAQAIVDNVDAGFTTTGTWTTSTLAPGYTGTNYVYRANAAVYEVDDGAKTGSWTRVTEQGFQGDYWLSACSGTPTNTWNLTVAQSGNYRVYARWVPPDASPTNAIFTVTHAGGTTNYPRDLNTGTDQWVLLGTHSFTSTGQVKLAGAVSGTCLSADAVRLEYVPVETANWAAPAAATYDVSAWIMYYSLHSSAVTYRITHAGGTTDVVRNQQAGGASWHPLGTFTFNGTAGQGVKVFANSTGMVMADAVRFQHSRYYYHLDHLGTPQKMTNQDQQVVWDASYEPFGKATVLSGTLTQPLRFPGQYFDAETGLHQNWNRDYDPSTGRYLQSDPDGLKGGINTYLYAKANPVRFVDPRGLSPVDCAFGNAAGCGTNDIPPAPSLRELCAEACRQRCREQYDREHDQILEETAGVYFDCRQIADPRRRTDCMLFAMRASYDVKNLLAIRRRNQCIASCGN